MDFSNIKNTKIIVFILILLLFPAVYGFGVTRPYWDENPLVMDAGQTTEFSLYLQNMVGEEDIIATASISGGEEFAQITDEKKEYLVPFGTRDVKVNIKVVIPEDAVEGNYNIAVKVNTAANGPPGMVQFGTGINQNIPLRIENGAPQPAIPDLGIESKENKTGNKFLLLTIIILVIIILAGIFIFVRRKKNESR